jgi:hypothetical protein
VFLAGCILLTVGQGCARQEPWHRSDGSLAASQQELPFHPERGLTEDGAAPAVPAGPQAPSAIPFHPAEGRVLPSGTLLTVQLEDSLSLGRVRAGTPFLASVAEPFTVAGHILIDRGSRVMGRVESALSEGLQSGGTPASGYFQLSLTSMIVNGRDLALQTSSLFTRGAEPSSHQYSRGAQLMKGRRLTFRLTAPVTLDDGGSIANRQYLAPGSE